MDLKGIIAISGKPGLYKVIGQGKNNIIVESLEDNKKIPAYAKDRISAIDDISIYTNEEDVPLKEVFTSIFKKENGNATISHKESAKKLSEYLSEVLPDYDKERVYPSDIKKIFQWYNMLHKNGLLKEDVPVAEETPVVEETKSVKKKTTIKADAINKPKVAKTKSAKKKEE